MDERVNCMACLVAKESDTLHRSVVTIGVVTHALARIASVTGTAYRLCAFNDEGLLKPGTYWEARVAEANIERLPGHGSRATREPQSRG